MKVRNCHIFSKQRGFKWPWKWYYGNPINHLFAKISEESCSITSEQFISKYVLPRKPVILKVLELCWSLWRDDVHFTLKNRACNLQIISQLIKFQGCLDVALFRRPANFGSFTFDSMIHRFFGGSTNMTESVSTLLFNNLEPAKSLVDTYRFMIKLSWQISTNCLLILKNRNSLLLIEIVFIRLQVFRPRLRKQILSLLSERNFTMDRNLLNEVGRPPQSLTNCA